jgi:ribonucleoside-diphosphate reductase alpha chain
MEKTSAPVEQINVPAEPKFCSIDNPECEACQ